MSRRLCQQGPHITTSCAGGSATTLQHGHSAPRHPWRLPLPLSLHCLQLPPPTTIVNCSHPPWHMHTHTPTTTATMSTCSVMEKTMWHLNDPLGMCHIVQTAMMAFIGQVSTLYALPPSFFCLIATTSSSHRNTHQPLPHHPLALCHLWHWWQHLTMVTWQQWRQADNDDAMWQWQWMSTMTIDDWGQWEEWDGQWQTTTRMCNCSPPPPAPPSFTLM